MAFKVYVDSPILKDRELFLKPLSGADSEISSIRSIDPDFIDTSFAQACLQNCMDNHSSECGKTDDSVLRYRPQIFLLDLHDHCLVSASVEDEFVALSYVWGPAVSTFECRKDTLVRLLEKGCLNDQSFFSVPPLISAAMEFTQQMKKRYLWVDRYCIVQDDDQHKHEQVMAMGVVYARACLTIILADGDARTGLTGLGKYGTAQPRNRNIFHGTNNSPILYGLRYHSIPADCSWVKRGWTFQEQMFSRRMAIFIEGKFVFRCRTSSQEDFEIDSQ
ncbi:HET-domain-containing protein [Lepidopterella palustris CBS 459.81]|uniref:HET-domain-containing protein n=1 Tax=Lepidopterella palustris CBS 459.81 TaxID=1314670 RepID=A0A8E2JFJ1_9PEZI|nr:HET-domain-containing protein [Lepidopterella palustris CBS 459.81]